MNDAERHRQTVGLPEARPFASVREPTEQLGVSTASIRQDTETVHRACDARTVLGGGSEGVFAPRSDRDVALPAKRATAGIATGPVGRRHAGAVVRRRMPASTSGSQLQGGRE